VDIPLKLDEGIENTEIKPEEVKEGIEVPLRLEEEPEEMDKVVEEMKISRGRRAGWVLMGVSYPTPPPGIYLGPADLRWSR
jgi:hypothetical protein